MIPQHRQLKDHTDSLILTVLRKPSSRVNHVALTKLPSNEQAFADVQYDNDDPQLPRYKGTKVIITQNQDKRNGVTNGQPATVVTMENATIVLKLQNGNIGCIHLVTRITDEKSTVSYPIAPAYVSTICKVQGQTSNKIVLWLNCQVVPQGASYVAMAWITTLNDPYFLVHPNPNHMKPVEVLTE